MMNIGKYIENYMAGGRSYDAFHRIASKKVTDEILSFGQTIKNAVLPTVLPLERKEFPGDDTKGTTLAFSGWSMPMDIMRPLFASFPGPVIGYQLPRDLIASDPDKAVEAFAELDALVQQDLKNPRINRVVGYSLGTAPAFHAANQIAGEDPHQLEQLIAIQVGKGIDSAVSRATITRGIVRKAIKDLMKNGHAETKLLALRKYKTDTRNTIGKLYDPKNNLDNLAAAHTPVTVFAGMRERIIKPAEKQFFRLKGEMERKELNAAFDLQEDIGHILILPYATNKIREMLGTKK